MTDKSFQVNSHLSLKCYERFLVNAHFSLVCEDAESFEVNGHVLPKCEESFLLLAIECRGLSAELVGEECDDAWSVDKRSASVSSRSMIS